MWLIFLKEMNPRANIYGVQVFQVLLGPFHRLRGYQGARAAVGKELGQVRLLDGKD